MVGQLFTEPPAGVGVGAAVEVGLAEVLGEGALDDEGAGVGTHPAPQVLLLYC